MDVPPDLLICLHAVDSKQTLFFDPPTTFAFRKVKFINQIWVYFSFSFKDRLFHHEHWNLTCTLRMSSSARLLFALINHRQLVANSTTLNIFRLYSQSSIAVLSCLLGNIAPLRDADFFNGRSPDLLICLHADLSKQTLFLNIPTTFALKKINFYVWSLSVFLIFPSRTLQTDRQFANECIRPNFFSRLKKYNINILLILSKTCKFFRLDHKLNTLFLCWNKICSWTWMVCCLFPCISERNWSSVSQIEKPLHKLKWRRDGITSFSW